MDSLSEYTQMTNYTVICGKKCNLFKNLARGAKLHNFEQFECAEDVKLAHIFLDSKKNE